MAAVDTTFSGSIPELYDTYLVPLIFEPYATDLARRVAALAPTDVLETAAGSGVVTRAVISLLPDMQRYVVSDLNQAMLDTAKSRQPPDDRVSFQQADAMRLPFADASFDVVLCQFGVMFFPDKVAGLRETRRVLRPGGRLLFNVWDRIEENGFTEIVVREATRMFPENPPNFLARTPHGYHDTRRIEADVREAGFQDVSHHDSDGAQHRRERTGCRHRLLPGNADARGARGPGPASVADDDGRRGEGAGFRVRRRRDQRDDPGARGRRRRIGSTGSPDSRSARIDVACREAHCPEPENLG